MTFVIPQIIVYQSGGTPIWHILEKGDPPIEDLEHYETWLVKELTIVREAMDVLRGGETLPGYLETVKTIMEERDLT
jgi:hypothetical protein